MFTSVGKLIYSDNPYKLIVEIDPEICNYYRALVPKYILLARQKYAPHISVVRKEIPRDLSNWKKYADQEIEFEYEGVIYNDETYYWLNVRSLDLEMIRRELGLNLVSGITKSPDGRHRFHTTIGNIKNSGG